MSILKSISFSGVDFTRLQAQPQRLPVENFRTIANIQCPQEMREFVQPTAQYIYNYIVDKATSNQLRAVHFNMLVADNFTNPELIILTTFVINMAYLKIKNGSFNNIQQAITTCAAWLVDRRINFITISENRLSQLCTENINEIRNAAIEYANEAEPVEALLANTFTSGTVSASFGEVNRGNNNMFGGGGQALTGFGGVQGTVQSAFGGNQGSFQSNNQASISGFGNSAMGNLSGFGQASQSRGSGISSVITRVDQEGAKLQTASRFDHDIHAASPTRSIAQAVAPKATIMQKEVVQDVVAKNEYFNADGTVNMAALKETNLPWSTNAYQPYALAYDASRYTVVNKALPGKQANQVIVISSLKKVDPMDRSAHTLTSSEHFLNQVLPEKVGLKVVSTREEFKEESLKKATISLKEVREAEAENDYVRRLDEFRSLGHIVLIEPVTSLQEAIAYARLAAMINMPGEFGAYQLEFKLVKEIPICNTDIAEVTKLMNYKTIHSLAAKIRGTIEDAHAPQSLRTAMVQINAYLAKQFLEYIRFYLCIDDYVNSDSFIDDALPMIEDIGNNIGTSYKETILGAQARFIDTYLNFGDALQNKVSEKTLNFLHDEKEETEQSVSLLPIVVPCLLTCTEFLNSEYNLKMPKDIGAMFTDETTTGGLFELVQESVSHPYSVGLQTNIKRFFIATLDDHVYETNIGLSTVKAPLLIKKLS